MANDFDAIILGQGLAGTTLAWTLRSRGLHVLVVDRDDPMTASRIAAGLVTPVTGKRFVKSRRFEEFLPASVAFYREIERITDTQLFTAAPSTRLFVDEREKTLLNKKSAREFPDEILHQERFAEPLRAPFGGFTMLRAARLDVPRYLDVSRDAFRDDGCFLTAAVDVATELRLESDSVVLPRLGIRCRRLIFCQGFEASRNPWFASVRFDAVKGEVLTVRIPGWNESRVLHRDLWIVPLGDGLYKVGATYDRDNLNADCTPAGREVICTLLRQIVRIPFEVVSHEAAVRPVLLEKKPAIGFHPRHPQLGYFNGLGSKGTLQAPWFAGLFANVITDETQLPDEFDVASRMMTCES